MIRCFQPLHSMLSRFPTRSKSAVGDHQVRADCPCDDDSFQSQILQGGHRPRLSQILSLLVTVSGEGHVHKAHVKAACQYVPTIWFVPKCKALWCVHASDHVVAWTVCDSLKTNRGKALSVVGSVQEGVFRSKSSLWMEPSGFRSCQIQNPEGSCTLEFEERAMCTKPP